MSDDIFDVPEEKLPKLSPEEYERWKQVLAIPDARPCDADGTFEAWLYRISLWGKIKITHINPELDVKHVFSPANFLEYIDDQKRNATYGLWKIEELKITRIRFYRTFMSISGKDVTEEIIVDIDLKPEFKAKMKQIGRRDSWLGKLGFFK